MLKRLVISGFLLLMPVASAQADRDVLAAFVQALPPTAEALAVTSSGAVVSAGDPLDVQIELRQAGVLAALVVNPRGDVTLIEGHRKLEPQTESLWKLLGVPAPKAVEPYGFTAVVMIHAPSSPWFSGDGARRTDVAMTDERHPRVLDALLTTVQERGAEAVVYVVQTVGKPVVRRGHEEETPVGALTPRQPERPIWLLGTQGVIDEP
jgi:hypothetical protein